MYTFEDLSVREQYLEIGNMLSKSRTIPISEMKQLHRDGETFVAMLEDAGLVGVLDKERFYNIIGNLLIDLTEDLELSTDECYDGVFVFVEGDNYVIYLKEYDYEVEQKGYKAYSLKVSGTYKDEEFGSVNLILYVSEDMDEFYESNKLSEIYDTIHGDETPKVGLIKRLMGSKPDLTEIQNKRKQRPLTDIQELVKPKVVTSTSNEGSLVIELTKL